MGKAFYSFYRIVRRISIMISNFFNYFRTIIIFKGHAVGYTDFKTIGTPFVMVANGGQLTIGRNFTMNNGIAGNPIGCYDPCTFFVDKGAVLTIGDDVGISQTALICHYNITIGNHVKIGGGVKIYDTDFHAIDPKVRAGNLDLKSKVKAQVEIKDNAFIGAFSIILKGVTVGENSVIGAGSVVTKSVPDNQIWAGNPAKFIRTL